MAIKKSIQNKDKAEMNTVCLPKVGDIVEGTMVSRGKSALFLDLGPKGIGIIRGQEFSNAKDQLKNLKEGESLTAKVVELENEEGYRELSLVEAHEEMAWQELASSRAKGDVIEITIKGANKGGLIAQVKGVQGFLPASQLLPEHYPKVSGAEPAKIAAELQKLVGTKMEVKIFDVDPSSKKLILSEKEIRKTKIDPSNLDLKVNDLVEGEISGVTNFGAFLKIDEKTEGLIYNSEMPISENNQAQALKIGQKVKAKILEINNDRVYLTLKDLAQERKP